MNFPHFFIDRPIFAGVISIVITIIGAIAIFSLPIAQYPEVAPPTIQVTANYPGANATVVAETVATPLEQQVNASDLPDDVKVKLQSYVSGCYGSLTSFNVLFAEDDDQFKGAGE